MSAKQPSSAALLRAVAECETISDEEIVAGILASASRARRLLTLGALLAALLVLLPFAVDLDRLIDGSGQWILILGLCLSLLVFPTFSVSRFPNARTVWDHVAFWPQHLWPLTPHQEQELLLLAQEHEQLRPYVARWVESGHPIRAAQNTCVRAWLSAVEEESTAASTAEELSMLRKQLLQSSGQVATD